ncbi:MAG: hypothetical protein K6G20_12415 [Ruminococcus sp.]|nr:hypothetical protein [Ruminococcus sp.]
MSAEFNNTGKLNVEYLNRGICTVNTVNGILINRRFLASYPDKAVFKLYRNNTHIKEKIRFTLIA